MVEPDGDALGRAVDLVVARGARAQLVVLHRGRVVLDRAFGCAPDALFMVFSAGKPFLAVVVHRLAERGTLDLDAPVARYWPRFARHGKDGVTLRHVLQHRAGLPIVRGLLLDGLAARDWTASVRSVESARPLWKPGTVPAYHVLSQGFVLGEVIRRVTGRDLRDVLHEEVLDPLGLADTYLGLPDAVWDRHVPVQGGRLEARVRARVFNRRKLRQAVIPAATLSTTAGDLARFYQALLPDAPPAEPRLLRPATMREATRPTSDGETDRLLRLPIRWSTGFQLGGPGPDPLRPRPLGRTSSRRAFGHNGSNCCLGWADPDRQLAVAYLTDRLESGLDGSPHLCAVSEAVLAACR